MHRELGVWGLYDCIKATDGFVGEQDQSVSLQPLEFRI